MEIVARLSAVGEGLASGLDAAPGLSPEGPAGYRGEAWGDRACGSVARVLATGCSPPIAPVAHQGPLYADAH